MHATFGQLPAALSVQTPFAHTWQAGHVTPQHVPGLQTQTPSALQVWSALQQPAAVRQSS
ncbi:MAG TPA: hypothetical protein VFP05_13810 [Thermomicrobiales bacterium]|nr:hypothetical protein [Thermomicrobiales bacterium]